MKVLIITGSPHKSGTTAVLADNFAEGAAAVGHEVHRFDAAFKNIHPCIACEKCHSSTGAGCAFKDDMEELNPILLAADVLVFVSPIYYYDINAQLKTVIDRFYANNDALLKNKKVMLLTAMADDTMESADGANISYMNMVNYMLWENLGILNAKSCFTAEDIAKTDYPQRAYEMGANL